MAETPTAIPSAEECANQVDLGCKPGEGGHTAAPCIRCEQLRARLTDQFGVAMRAVETAWRSKIETLARARLSATAQWAAVLRDNERLGAAFKALRVVFDMDPTEAGRIAHEAWIGLMLERSYHPFDTCVVEKGCAHCDMELMSWEELPEARRMVREAGVEALFRELKQRAKLDQVDAGRREAEASLAELSKAVEKPAEPAGDTSA